VTLKVLLTVDTEVYPISTNWKEDRLSRDIQRDIYGRVGDRSVGLDYQLEVLNRSSLKAVFFVESLFSAVAVVGHGPLQEILQKILDGGHEVQLHMHPEWIPHCPDLNIEFRGGILRLYSLEEQTELIAFASEKLQRCGAPTPLAFRAGDFAADNNTIKALCRVGIEFDSSFSVSYEGRQCRLPFPESFGKPTDMGGGIIEIPVGAIEDYPGHLRHAQLAACGGNELIHALNEAEARGWDFFVIVLHSFEMLSRRRSAKPVFIRESVVKRFAELCLFLSRNRDRFQTVGFEDLREAKALENVGARPIPVKGRIFDTLGRVIEQGIDRLQLRFR
jgi:hypothetical protein